MKMKRRRRTVPSKRYIEKQRSHKNLLDQPGESEDLARKHERALESDFMRAWGFEHARGKAAMSIRAMAGRVCEGFDHCTYYHELDSSDTVIVTQPYARAETLVEKLQRGLSLGNWLRPQIIAAPEWAFYYPGQATLIILKFPRGYQTALAAISKLWPPF
jgi:hypothetical protein